VIRSLNKILLFRTNLRPAIGISAPFGKLEGMRYVCWLVSIVVLAGCVQSPKGTVKELVTINQPTFGGLTDRVYTVPSNFYSLIGECSPVPGLQWSYDQVTWTPITCSANGHFSIPLHILGFLDVYARHARPGGFTKTSHARTVFANAPTTPTFQLVTSGASDQDNAAGTQNAVDPTMTSATLNGGSIIIKQSLIDSTYE
jgi:hypothetical protein